MKRLFHNNVNLTVIFMCLIYLATASSQEMPVPASLQGELVPKILLLSKGFAEKKVVVIGIIYSGYLRSSTEAYYEISTRLKNAQLGISFKVIPIEISETLNYKEAFSSSGINCVYIAPVRGVDLSAINKACKDLKILSISAIPSLVNSYFSIGFDLFEEKPKIIINQKSIDNEGITLSSRLLKISRIYP
jgi:hypothetical protein